MYVCTYIKIRNYSDTFSAKKTQVNSTFQWDNYPRHTGRMWLNTAALKSPDLYPLKSFWEVILNKLYTDDFGVTNRHEL